jgi:hypothetical protein
LLLLLFNTYIYIYYLCVGITTKNAGLSTIRSSECRVVSGYLRGNMYSEGIKDGSATESTALRETQMDLV